MASATASRRSDAIVSDDEDMSARETAERERPSRPSRGGRLARRAALRLFRLFGGTAFSSLTRRIVLLNLGGLVTLVLAVLYLNQFREGLIESRVQSLLTQGEIIAGAIAASATLRSARSGARPASYQFPA